jgi:hypothetical protein
MLVQENAIKKLNKNELRELYGGLSISGTIITAFTNGIKTIFEMGRSLGSSIRRLSERKLCEIS